MTASSSLLQVWGQANEAVQRYSRLFSSPENPGVTRLCQHNSLEQLLPMRVYSSNRSSRGWPTILTPVSRRNNRARLPQPTWQMIRKNSRFNILPALKSKDASPGGCRRQGPHAAPLTEEQGRAALALEPDAPAAPGSR